MRETVVPDVADSLDALIRAINRAYRARLNERGIDLTPPEIQALRFLTRNPGAGPQRLAAESGRDKAQITRTIQALEDRGLVLRGRDPDDQRCHRLELSRHGQHTCAVIREIRRTIEARLFAELDTAEQRQLATLLRRCLAPLQAEDAGPG